MEGEQNNVGNMSMDRGESTGSSTGLIIGLVIILAIIILGGLYFWNARTTDLDTDQTVESINMQNDSDAAAAIEADLNATDVDTLDVELNAS